MNKALHDHLQKMLARFSKEINRREPPGLTRTIAMYMACRRAHQQAREEPERAWWKRYLGQLEQKAAEQKAEILKRRAS